MYKSIAEIRNANKIAGGDFFSKGKSDALPVVYRGYLFITKDLNFENETVYKIRECLPSGRIITPLSYAFGTIDEAIAIVPHIILNKSKDLSKEEDFTLSVDGEEMKLSELIKVNTSNGVDQISQTEFNLLKALKVGQCFYFGMSTEVKRIS